MNVSPRIEHLHWNISSSSQTKLNLRASSPLSGTITISRVSAVHESEGAGCVGDCSYTACSTLRNAATSLKFFTSFLLCRRFNVCNSFPSLHLLRERTLCTIGVVPHTKVFVNLKQSLLVRDGFQELFPTRIVSKKTRRSCFKSSVR
jgi:hypothetical protein